MEDAGCSGRLPGPNHVPPPHPRRRPDQRAARGEVPETIAKLCWPWRNGKVLSEKVVLVRTETGFNLLFLPASSFALNISIKIQ